jgi:hypothetical protein
MEARQAEVARELAEKGYVETDEVDPDEEEVYDKWASALWESLVDKLCSRRQKFADPGGLQVGLSDHTTLNKMKMNMNMMRMKIEIN